MLVGTAIAVLGLYVLIRERGSRIGVVFWGFSASICTWLVAIGAAYASLREPQAMIWIKFSIIGAIFIPVTALALAFTIVRRAGEFRRIIWAGVAVSILFCLGVAFTDLFIRRVYHYFWGYYPQYGPLGVFFILYFFGIMAYILRLYWIEYQGSTNDRHKKRLKGLLIAFSIGYLASADFLTTVGVPLYPFGFIPIIPFLFITAYVIMRYRLVDITPELAAGQILETMQGAVIAVDLEGKIRVINRTAQEMLGYQKSELLGRDIGSILPALTEYNTTALTNGKSSSFEMTWHGRQGQQFFVSVSISSIINATDNSPAGIIYMAHDITERRRVQDELEFRNLLLSTQQETSPDGILVVNEGGTIISYNQRFIELWRIPPDMVAAKDDMPVLQLNTSQTADPAGFVARVKYLYEHKEEKSHEEILLKDGRVIDRYSAPMFASNGKYYGRVWYFRDITERKQAEERLTESLSLKRATLESTADGILVVDGRGKVVDFNNKFMELWGLPPDLMERKDDDRLLEHVLSHLKDPESFVHKVRELYDKPDAEDFDEVQFKDGRIFERYSIPHRLEGKSVGRVWSFRDVTERKQAEERLKKYSEELREVNEELKSFAYIVSHDLRVPLINIKGFSEELIFGIKEMAPLLRKHLDGLEQENRQKFSVLLDKDIPEALAFIGSSVARMDNQINAILKLSRAGRRKLNPEPLQLQDVVQGILNTLAHQIESRNITVTVGGLPDLVADRTAMEQIFGNLLDNAIKYLEPARPGTIAVNADRRSTEIIFHVRDNGRGMAQEDIPRVFELFRRVGKQDVPGEGMGLAYVKTLLRSLGGRIWCESEPGVGTTFSVALPVPVDASGGLLSMTGGGRP